MRFETKRLILRNFRDGDIKDVVEGINNLDVSRWLLVVPYPYTKKDASWWISESRKKVNDKTGYSFAVELKSEKKVIGGMSLKKVDKFQGIATLGYWLNENYWRMGLGSEALDVVLKFAFNKLKLRRVEAEVFVGNSSSGKLLEKFGAKKEGLKRKAARIKADGKIKDEIIYGLLKEEWRQLK